MCWSLRPRLTAATCIVNTWCSGRVRWGGDLPENPFNVEFRLGFEQKRFVSCFISYIKYVLSNN